MGMPRRETRKFGEDVIADVFVEGACLEIKGPEPRSGAASGDRFGLGCQKEPPAETLSPQRGGNPESVDHQPGPHGGTIEAADHGTVLGFQREVDGFPISRSQFDGIGLANALAHFRRKRGGISQRVDMECHVDGFVILRMGTLASVITLVSSGFATGHRLTGF